MLKVFSLPLNGTAFATDQIAFLKPNEIMIMIDQS